MKFFGRPTKSSSGGTDSSVPLTQGALPPGAPSKVRCSANLDPGGLEYKEPVPRRVPWEDQGEH